MNPHDTKVSQNNMYKTGGSMGIETLNMNYLQNIINWLLTWLPCFIHMNHPCLRRAKSVRWGFKGELNILKFKLMKHLFVSLQVANPARKGLASHRKRVLRSQQRCWHEA